MQKPKITLLMNTITKNMLLFIGKIKRSVSDGKAMGKSRDFGEICPY